MKHKPVFYIDAIKLIKHIALKSQSKLEHQSITENVCPWTTLKYHDLTIEINQYYHMIRIGALSVKVPPLLIKNHPQHRPLSELTGYLWKIFDNKSKRREFYDNGNSLEIYSRHLKALQKES